MNILLLGEFSALHKNLKEGLEEIGHSAITISTGDGFKKIVSDINLNSKYSGIIEKLDYRYQWIKNISKLKNYDVVQLVNPFVLPNKLFPKKQIINRLIKNNNKLFLCAAGDDSYFWKYGRKTLKYGPFDDYLKYDLQANKSIYEEHKNIKFNEWIVNKSNGVIPIMYEYEISYKNCKKRLNTIPIPINLNKIKYEDNIVKNKIVIFHGLNRYGFKGTRHVEEAFKILSSQYPNDLELIIDGNMPLKDYIKVMSRTNIVIDQTNTYSCGVNAIFALAMGKVVLGGAEQIALPSLGVDTTPVINIEPNYQSIVAAIENLMAQKNKIVDIGFKSRQFAEQTHSHTKVAQKYIDTWQNN